LGGTYQVAWPADATGFVLQGATQIGTAWQPITTGIVTNGTMKVYEFVPAPGIKNGFFRLLK
jgi:hypothetical protein